MDYIEKLISLRKSKKITIVELAERMGVPQTYIAQIESRKITPTTEQLEVIKDFVDGKL